MYTTAPWLTGGPAARASAIWTSRGVELSTWRTVERSTELPARSWPAGETQNKAIATEAARTGCIGHLRGHDWCVVFSEWPGTGEGLHGGQQRRGLGESPPGGGALPADCCR